MHIWRAAAGWALSRCPRQPVGPVATLIERDNDIPAFAVMLAEANRAEGMLRTQAASMPA